MVQPTSERCLFKIVIFFIVVIIIKLISYGPGLGSFIAFFCAWICPCTPLPLLLNNFFQFHFNDGQTHFCLFDPCPPPPPTGKEKQDASEGNGDAMEQGVPLGISWTYCRTDHDAKSFPFLWSLSSFFSCSYLHSCLIPIHSLHSSQSDIFKTIKS